MPGHDARRSSHSAEPVQAPARALWHKKIDALIPSRSQIITVEASSGTPAMVLVTAADGIHSLDPDTGAERWLYAMDMPPGDAPSVEGRSPSSPEPTVQSTPSRPRTAGASGGPTAREPRSTPTR